MINQKNMSKKCRLLLSDWQENLHLSNYEKSKFDSILNQLKSQIEKLAKKEIHISVFGRVGVGKSSLLNALIKKQLFPTDIINGNTKQTKSYIWEKSFQNFSNVHLIDTPGIDEIISNKKDQIAFNYSLNTDLILFVVDSDLTKVELNALKRLVNQNKPIFLILNRCDQWNKKEAEAILSSIQKKLSFYSKRINISLAASSPRKAKFQKNGTIRSEPSTPKIETLKNNLQEIIDTEGELLVCINSLQIADRFYKILKEDRLRRKKEQAQSLIGKYAALKASGVAINPLLIFDLITGIAFDSALVIQLSKLYGLEIGGPAARQLVKKLTIYNSFLGGAQIGIQMTLSILQKILFIISPVTGGLSLAPAAPIAVAQVALAVHTTKRTGRIAAQKFLIGTNKRDCQPRLMLKDLLQKSIDLRMIVGDFNFLTSHPNKQQKLLLP